MRFKTKLFCGWLFTVGALFAQGPPPPGFGPGGVGGHGRGPGGPGFGGPTITGAPFSGTKTETHQQTLSDGTAISQTRTEKVYRDADGRMRSEATITLPSGTAHTSITIFDPVSGFVAHLNPTDSTAFKMTLHAPPADAPLTHPKPPSDANSPHVVVTDLGNNTVEGVAATGKSIVHTIPVGAIGNSQAIVDTREIWTSTVLKIPVKVTTTDPEHGNSTMVLTVTAQTAPDPTLFQIPSTYIVKDAPSHGGPHRHGHAGPDGPAPDGDAI